MIYDSLISKEKKLAVIGLGYVGLPIALLFAKKISVIGFDINQKRIEMMRNNIDPSGELTAEDFNNVDITFTDDLNVLRQASFYIVAVPTPIDQHNQPDLTPVLSASDTLSKVLKPGDYAVYESTVYPGCTEEDCLPILLESGLSYPTEFKLGYSPERINPGDRHHTLDNTVKIVSGCDSESLDQIEKVYSLVIKAGLHKAPSIKVAEAAKIIENTQRDVNIALMNELSLIFNKMGINTYDVIEAAGTKWNFQRYQPGLVGGHCIGVDPYYLTYKASELGYHSKVILSGRQINDSMGFYIGETTVKKLTALGKLATEARVLVMGITFKENVQDIRNSKVVDLVKELREFHVNVDIIDPFAVSEDVHEEYGFSLTEENQKHNDYDAVIIAVPHEPYKDLTEADFQKICKPDGLIVDIKGLYRNQIHQMHYWSL